MNRTIAAYLTCSAALLIGMACTMQNSLSGGGTDVSNPVVVGKAIGFCGAWASETRVMLIPAGYNACTDGSLPASSIDTADSSGSYLVTAPSAGVFNIEAEHLPTGNMIFIALDTLRMNDTMEVPLDMIWHTGAIKVLFPDVSFIDSAYVYIPGTTFFAFISSGYAFIDSVPAGLVTEIRYVNLLDSSKNHVVQEGVSVSSGNITMVADYYSWKYSRQLVLNTSASGAGVDGDMTDFPVLVRLNRGNFNFSQAQSHGEDIRFATPNYEPLDYDIDTWDSAGAAAAIWVKVDKVYGGNAGQYIMMCWGNKNATDLSGADIVFDTGAGYRAVWHLNESSGSVAAEVTWYGVLGTYFGSLPNRIGAGAVGGCQSFNGYGDYVGMGTGVLDPGLNSISFSVWVKRGDTGKTTTILAKSNGDSPCVDYGYIMAIDWNSYVHFYMATDGNSWGDSGSFNMLSSIRLTDMTSWHHLFIVVDRAANSNCKLYIDGTDRTGTIHGDVLKVGPITNALPLRMGIEADAGYPYKGYLDEVTVSYCTRSAEWVRLCYMNQKTVDALVVFK